MDKNCSSCACFANKSGPENSLGRSKGSGTCRSQPPILFDLQDGGRIVSMWPEVNEDGWCSKWSGR
jgi:hypothetical protein